MKDTEKRGGFRYFLRALRSVLVEAHAWSAKFSWLRLVFLLLLCVLRVSVVCLRVISTNSSFLANFHRAQRSARTDVHGYFAVPRDVQSSEESVS